MVKTKKQSVSFNTQESINENNSQIEDLAVIIAKLISKKHLNYRQAIAVLELVQAEIKECRLEY